MIRTEVKSKSVVYLDGVNSSEMVEEAYEHLLRQKREMLDFLVEDGDAESPEFRSITSRFVALAMVMGLDIRAELASLRHLSDMGGWKQVSGRTDTGALPAVPVQLRKIRDASA